MSITTKPSIDSKKHKNIDIDAIINKGGSVAKNQDFSVLSKNRKIRKNILIKLYEDTVNEIEKLIDSRKIKIARLQWIEEAIHEKIEREIKN